MIVLPLDYVISATRYLQFRLKRPAARRNVRLLETPLARVRVLDTGGGGQTVAFLCDGPAVIEHYDDLLALAPPQMRIIVVEMPGFGFSYPRPGYNYSLNQQSLVLSCVFDLLGATGTCLVAPCVTAYAALTLCELRPNLVASLCVIQAPCWAEERRWAKRIDNAYLLTPVLGQLVMAFFSRRVATTWIRNAVGTNDVAHRFADVAVHAISAGACFCLASLAQHLFGERVVDPVFAPVQTPSMALWGMADRTHHATDIESTTRLLPRASITEVPAAGHFVELEQPALFWQLLCERFNLAS